MWADLKKIHFAYCNFLLILFLFFLIDRQRLESLSKGYYKAIMSDVTQILENYMELVKNFPLVFNGTKLKQTIENFGKKINLVQFFNILE
jgi:hypothetical protein